MFIPLRTDRSTRRRPVVTEGLIVLNLIVYLAGSAGKYFDLFPLETMLYHGEFRPTDFNVLGLITYQFLHDPMSIWHLAFNMLFLWIFGGAVEDRMHRLGFLAFYLAGGAVAGLAHALASSAPIIGASGAVAAVAGAFLALFPRSRIKVLFIFIIIGVYNIPSAWFIGAYFAIDLLNQIGAVFGHSGGVAYMAHLSGYVFGFGLAFALLAVGAIPRGEWDIFRLFTQARRRRAFRASSAGHVGGMWASSSADTERQLRQRTVEAPAPTEDERRREAARSEIMRRLAAADHDGAVERYAHLLDEDETPMAAPVQLDLANALYRCDDAERAARAYEIYLRHYARGADADQVRLMLGLIYARRLDRADRARELVSGIVDRLRDAEERALAKTILDELG